MLPAGVLVSAQAFRPWVHIPEAAHFSCPKPAGPGIPQRLSKDANQLLCSRLTESAESVPVRLSNWGRKLLEKQNQKTTIYIKHV